MENLGLKSNDWDKYRPKVILVEILGSSLSDVERHEIVVFLRNFNYFVFAKAFHTVFFVQNS